MRVRRTQASGVNQKFTGVVHQTSESLRHTGPFVEFENLNLDELGDGQILEAAVLHSMHKFWSNVEDPDLDQFIKGRLQPQGAELTDFVTIHALHFECNELVRVGLVVAHADKALRISRINFEYAQRDEVVGRDALDVGLLQRTSEVAGDVEYSVSLK